MWKKAEALKVVKILSPYFIKYGYKKPMIVGSVKTKGRSVHDLDIVTEMVREDADWEGLQIEIEDVFDIDFENTSVLIMGEEEECILLHLPEGKLIDVFFNESIYG